MKSGRFLNLSNVLYGGALLMLGAILPCDVYAQAQSYSPPPMFEDPTPPMVRPESKDGNIVQPRSSERPDESQEKPVAVKAPVMNTKVSVDADHVKKAPPVPPVKPVAPVSAKAETIKQPVAKPVAKPVVPVVAVPKVEAPKVAAPVTPTVAKVAPPKVARDPKVSAITGPKTMPSLPVNDVEGQKTFEPAKDVQASREPTMLERQQMQAAVKQDAQSGSITPVVPRPKDGVAPTSFERGDQGALKKTYAYEPGQISLGTTDTDALAVAVVKRLDAKENKDWRVQIKSFATAYGNGLSSDRRIALSRALSLRTSLIAQGVPAAKIDVLAQGQETQDGKPGDRIDLYLYGPRHD